MGRTITTWAGGLLLLGAVVLLALTLFAQVDGPDHGIFCQTEGRDLEVLGVLPGSRWEAAGFRPGDRIQAIDGRGEELLDHLYAVKIGQRDGGVHRFEVRTGSHIRDLVYHAGPAAAGRILNSANLSIGIEVLVKLVFLGTAAYFLLRFRPVTGLSLLSGALFLLLALLTPFFQLNLAYLLSELGEAAGRVLLEGMLLVCFLPAVVATLGALLPPTERPVIRPRFLLRLLLAVLGLLYLSYSYVCQDFFGRLAAGVEPAALLPFFPVFRLLNGAFLFLLICGGVAGFSLMMAHLQRREAVRRMSAFNRLMGLVTLGLALPLVAGFLLVALGWQFTPFYGLRKLAYILFPLLYVHAVHYFTRRPDDAPHDPGPHPAR